jgi:arginine-tRNA-protein transferase
MNILNLLHFCRRNKISLLYLGYLIKGISSMSYKASFKPHELHFGGSWKIFSRD